MKVTCQPGYLIVAVCETPFKKHPTLHITEEFRQMCWCKVIESGSGRVNKGDLVYIPRQTEPIAMDMGTLYGLIHDSQVRASITNDDAPDVKLLDNSAEEVSEQISKARAKAMTEAAASKILNPR